MLTRNPLAQDRRSDRPGSGRRATDPRSVSARAARIVSRALDAAARADATADHTFPHRTLCALLRERARLNIGRASRATLVALALSRRFGLTY